MILCSIRYFGMSNITDIERLTFREYRLLMKGSALRILDEEESLYVQAWLSREIEATRPKGKNSREYVYKDFKRFFNKEKRENMILKGGTAEESQPQGMLERIAAFRERKGGIENG